MKKLILWTLLICLFFILIIQNRDFFIKKIILSSVQCTGNQANRLELIAYYFINNLNYPSIQLAYLDAQNHFSGCVAGWEKLPVLSPRITQETTMQYASTTKLFTSDLILDLVRNKKIKLDDKIVDLLNINHKNNADIENITVSHLLTHRAGFDRNKTPDPMIATQYPFCPYHVEQLYQYELDFQPDSKMVYSNIGYCLLGKIIEVHKGVSYITAVKQHSAFSSKMQFIQELPNTSPHIPIANQGQTPIPKFDYYALNATGGLIGTAQDLAKAAAIMRRKPYPNILSRPKNMPCDTHKINGCHGYTGYEYRPNPKLGFIWRNGSMVNSCSWVVMDSDGGNLVIISNYRNESDDNLKLTEQLLQQIYQLTISGSLKKG